MLLKELKINNFRNFNVLSLYFSNAGALFFGENGAGKTNVLESIYLLYTGRSQRGALKRDMVTWGSEEGSINGILQKSYHDAQISMSLRFNRDRMIDLKKNSKKIKSLSDLMQHNTVVYFGTQDIFLVLGDVFERMKFIDVLLSQTDQRYFAAILYYKKFLLHRSKLLSSLADKALLERCEEKMAEHGSYITTARHQLFKMITPIFSEYFKLVNMNKVASTLEYHASIKGPYDSENECRESIKRQLHNHRQKDIYIGCTSAGIHRDDFQFFLNGRKAHLIGSQGQLRTMAVALRLSSLSYLEKYKEGPLVLLVDDAFSELDNVRKENIYGLMSNKGQIFLTSLSYKEYLFSSLPRFCVNNNTVLPL